MKNTKHQLIPFSTYDLTGMEQHLEKMARKGWLLDKISALGWRYRRIEPKALHFTVSYCHRASAYDPEPTEEVQTFHDFCAHTGWHLAAEFGSMQVFYNDQEDPTPIDTDPALEIQMVGREVMRMLPAQIFLLLLGFWMGGSWCYSLVYEPIDLLASPTSLFTGLCWLGLMVWSVADLITYLIWRRKARQAAQRGEFVPTHGCHRIMQVVMALVVVGVVYFFAAARLPGLRLLTGIMILGFVVLFLAVIWVIVFMNDSERRIPVQYAKRVVGNKMYGGQNTHIPIKVNMSGVMPIIFASSILMLPTMILSFMTSTDNFWYKALSLFSVQGIFYAVIYFILIIGFAYFYATIQFNPIEMANNLRKNGGAIPGIRPGKSTSDFISKILSRITLMGALFLSVIAILPIIIGSVGEINISLGGTSVLIMVGVALDTVRNLESQMMMRHYKGFLD